LKAREYVSPEQPDEQKHAIDRSASLVAARS
jgi:hypothetical protein